MSILIDQNLGYNCCQIKEWPWLLLVEEDHQPQEALLRHSHQKDQVMEDLYNPQEVVKDHYNPWKVLVVEAYHSLQKAVEGH